MYRKKTFRKKPCKDHLGNQYSTIKSMCRQWNIEPETFTRRRNVYGLDLEQALTRSVKPNGGQRCFDHTGKKFKSRTSMCGFYHIDRKLFEYRISHGWSLEDALTKERRKRIVKDSIERDR